MNIQSTQKPVNTPYQKIINSKVGRLVRDNKVGTGATAVGATAVISGAAFQSDTFAQVAEHAILPAVGAGVSVLGAAAVHDAIVNDVGEKNMKATAKIALGSAATLGGAQVVGMSYNIPVLEEAFTGLVFDHGQSLVGGALIGGAAVAGKAAVGQFQKATRSEEKVIPLALGTGATVGTAGAGLAGIELVGRDLNIPVADRALSGTIEFLAETPAASVLGGGLLVGGAAVAGTQAAKNFGRDGNPYATAALASGATAGALGGLEMLGHGLGLEATRGLFTGNAPLVGSLSLSAFGGAVTKHAVDKIAEDGATPFRALSAAAGTTAMTGGLTLAAGSLEQSGLSRFLGDGTSVVAGAGLGYSSYAFGKSAVKAAKEKKFGTALFHGAGAATTAAGGLTAVGHGLGIEGLERVGSKVAEYTVEPLAEHVLLPTLEFLFENPIPGAIGLAAVVGGFAYSQLKD